MTDSPRLVFGEGLKTEGTSSAADQVALSRERLEGGSKSLLRASVASPGRLIRKRSLTARPPGDSVPEASSINMRQGVSEPNQVGEKLTLRAVVALIVVECRSYTTPGLTQLGWRYSARSGAT